MIVEISENMLTPLEPDELLRRMAMRRIKRPFYSSSPEEVLLAQDASASTGMDYDMALRHFRQDLNGHAALCGEWNAWLAGSTPQERMVLICEFLVDRSEHVDSDRRWQRMYGKLVSDVFDAPCEIGAKALETTKGDGSTRWSRLVARATAEAILQHREFDNAALASFEKY